MSEKTLGELAEYVGGRVCGNADVVIRSASTLGIMLIRHDSLDSVTVSNAADTPGFRSRTEPLMVMVLAFDWNVPNTAVRFPPQNISESEALIAPLSCTSMSSATESR